MLLCSKVLPWIPHTGNIIQNQSTKIKIQLTISACLFINLSIASKVDWYRMFHFDKKHSTLHTNKNLNEYLLEFLKIDFIYSIFVPYIFVRWQCKFIHKTKFVESKKHSKKNLLFLCLTSKVSHLIKVADHNHKWGLSSVLCCVWPIIARTVS